MELATRRVRLAGLTANPVEAWMLQVARNVTDAEEGFLRGKKYLLMDREGKFSEAFRATVEQARVEAVRLPPRSPNLNSHRERFMGSINAECLDRMVFFGERTLLSATTSFVEHYHVQRNHQGLANELSAPGEKVGRRIGSVACRDRLGGLLRYYHREAA